MRHNISAPTAVAVHTLETTSPDRQLAFIDHGRFAQDLAVHGLALCVTNKGTFSHGGASSVTSEGALVPVQIDTEGLGAMHVRPLANINVAGSEGILKLNENSLKDLGRSKIELYRNVLSSYQVPTEFLSLLPEDLEAARMIIDAIATPEVALKSNSGAGGGSTKILDKSRAIAWLTEAVSSGNEKPHIVQPKVEFGRLPRSITAIGSEAQQALVKRAYTENLLTELRFFTTKFKDDIRCVPVLRVVPVEGMSMSGQNDEYVDVEIEAELHAVLEEAARTIINKAAQVSGVDHALATIDFYFDKNGNPHVMEGNLRSPQLPTTRENPVSGRLVHQAVASVLAGMALKK